MSIVLKMVKIYHFKKQHDHDSLKLILLLIVHNILLCVAALGEDSLATKRKS